MELICIRSVSRTLSYQAVRAFFIEVSRYTIQRLRHIPQISQVFEKCLLLYTLRRELLHEQLRLMAWSMYARQMIRN